MTNENLFLSEDGQALVKAFESCLRRVAAGFVGYYCPAGKFTIGWGHTNDHGRKFDASTVWSQLECDAAFAEDMRGFENVVKRLVKVNLQQCQFDACVSFSYNAGEGGFAGSTLLRKINAGDFEGAAREFGKWIYGTVGGVKTKLKGLVRRRASESLMFQGIPDKNYDGIADMIAAEGGMPQAVDAPEPPKSTISSKTVQTATTVGTTVEAGVVHEISKEVVVTQAPPDTGMFEHLLDLVVSNVDRIMRSPWLWIGIIAAMGVGYIIFDRRKKLREENI